jgi:hypothetical protein
VIRVGSQDPLDSVTVDAQRISSRFLRLTSGAHLSPPNWSDPRANPSQVHRKVPVATTRLNQVQQPCISKRRSHQDHAGGIGMGRGTIRLALRHHAGRAWDLAIRRSCGAQTAFSLGTAGSGETDPGRFDFGAVSFLQGYRAQSIVASQFASHLPFDRVFIFGSLDRRFSTNNSM